MNLIPSYAGTTPNYFCTWAMQNAYARLKHAEPENPNHFMGDHGLWLARDTMNEENFREWLTQHPQIRQDLFLLLDYGWDVPYAEPKSDTEDGLANYELGSLEVNEARFPSFGGTPAQRLRQLNDAAKQAGWKGIGIWVCAQNAAKSKDGFLDPESPEMEAYYRERARWSAEAGVEYWKVDFGHHGDSVPYRSLLTRVAREEAPGLVVEHASGLGPFNAPDTTGRYADERALQSAIKFMRFSEVLRSYDISVPLSGTTTLDRMAELLPQSGDCLVNCEDEPVIGAALGCVLGVMRGRLDSYPYPNLFFPTGTLDEVTRAVRWQRIAPAFSGGVLALSEAVLTDSHFYEDGDTWDRSRLGRIIDQRSHAVFARNLLLPEVKCDGEPPFVLASRNPNGAVTVATLGRRNTQKGAYMPRADVRLTLPETPGYLGALGRFGSLELHLPEPFAGKIFAQDMMGGEAEDITAQVTADGNTLRFSGALLERTGLASATPGDPSVPGTAIKIALE